MPGVWRAVSHNEGAVVIYHSPKACGHIGREMDLGMHFRSLVERQFCPEQYAAPLIISGLQAEHSVFGGAELLRKCIEYAARRYKPKYILIANSCVAGVIGDDTAAVASDAEADLRLPVMSVPCYGYLDGDYYTGFYHAGIKLAERFMTRQPKLSHTVTLLGDRGGPSGTDVQEFKRMFAYFGLIVHSHFPAFASLEDIKRVPCSAMTIPLSGTKMSYPWIRKLGMKLDELLSIPFFDGDDPTGWQATSGWLTELGRFLQQEQAAAVAVEMERTRLTRHIAECGPLLKGKKIVLCIGRPLTYFDPAWVLELISLYGIIVIGVAVLDEMLTKKQECNLRQELRQQKEIFCFSRSEGNAVLFEAADFVITTHELPDVRKKQLFLPLLPLAGVGGIITLMTKLVQLAQRHERRGGILYV